MFRSNKGQLRMYAALLPLAALAFAAVVAFEISKRNRSLPKLLYYAVIFVHPVFVLEWADGLKGQGVTDPKSPKKPVKKTAKKSPKTK